jgi:hypothetical protein
VVRVIVVLLCVGLVALTGWTLWIQNSARTAVLSFDAGFAAWQLAQPQPVLLLMGFAAMVGLLVGLVFGWWFARPKASVPVDAPFGDGRAW